MLAMGPRDLNSAPYSPVRCSSHSMTSFQSSELTELPVVENSQLFAQRTVRPPNPPLTHTHTSSNGNQGPRTPRLRAIHRQGGLCTVQWCGRVTRVGVGRSRSPDHRCTGAMRRRAPFGLRTGASPTHAPAPRTRHTPKQRSRGIARAPPHAHAPTQSLSQGLRP